ncbi:MAG: HindVP family restriction endonuclease [Pseudodesulfovibrio sp.]|nr:HindVP family restriction endonuclease [Pseudodesulfovibrio sp.]
MTTKQSPTLYGIENSNRKPKDFWGKNQFNSSFPVSLACYMRDQGWTAQYLHVDENLDISIREIPFDEVFNSNKKNTELTFNFESKFDPYQQYTTDDIKNIDLVVADGVIPIRPLEIKLTAVPDQATHNLEEVFWGPEIVVRPASTSYAALGIFHNIHADLELARSIIEPTAQKIKQWGNKYEISAHFPKLMRMLDNFQLTFHVKQQPFLMQIVWKTKGKQPYLNDNAFDIFVWSDYALCRLFIKNSRKELGNGDLNRFERSTARFSRFLYEATTRGTVPLKSIYTEMAFDLQTDKELAANGRITNKYLQSERLLQPLVHKDHLFNIILNEGETLLSPERRLDQSVYIQAIIDGKIAP